MKIIPISSILRRTALVLGLGLGTAAGAADLRLNIPADPAQIDPITYSELVAGDVLSNVYEGFTGIDAEGNVVPALALEWEDHDDNFAWRFHLRPGVKFHSGRPFTAKDVKYTYEQLLIPGNKGGLNASFLDNVVGADAVKEGKTTELEGVSIVDDLTVDVFFTKHEVLFPIYPIAFMDSGIVAEKGPEWYNSVSAGTGPFKFAAWNRGQEVVLAANPDYWGGAPKIDGVRFVVVPDGDTAISMYEAGELDLVYAEDTVLRRILTDSQFEGQRLTASAAQTQYIGMNKALYPPFEDKRVREAVCRSFDRDAIVSGLYEGAAVPLLGLVPPKSPGYSADVKGVGYDPERAKALIAEAGYPGGKGLPAVKMQTTEPNRNFNLYLASQFQEVLGMPVEVEIVERKTLIAAMNAGEVPFFHWGWTADYPDALTFLGEIWYGPSPYNRARVQDADYDALIAEAEGQGDTAARLAIYHKAEQQLLDNFDTCGTVARMQVALKKPNVEGVELTPFRFLPFRNVTIGG